MIGKTVYIRLWSSSRISRDKTSKFLYIPNDDIQIVNSSLGTEGLNQPIKS